MPPNVLAFRAPIPVRHSSLVRSHDFGINLPGGNGRPSTRNQRHGQITLSTDTTKAATVYSFADRCGSMPPNHEELVTRSRNDGPDANPDVTLHGPGLDALGGLDAGSLGLRRSPVAVAAPAGAAALLAGDHSAAGTARAPSLTDTLLAACILTSLAAATYALATHPLAREALAGSVLAIWPAWCALGAVFGVAAWAGRA